MRPISHSDAIPLNRDAARPGSASVGRNVTSPEKSPLDRTIRKQAIIIFCLLMFCYSYVHQRPGWNQNARLDLLHAIFVHKTLKIDAYHENTGDKSIHDGHYYSDKAPGVVVLALPAFALSAGVLEVLDIDIDSTRGWLISDWITTALSVGLITALGGAFMFLFLCKLVAARYAFLTTLAVFLGSSPFPYATMLFSHAAVIGLLCIALWAIADNEFLIRHLGDQSKIQNPKSKIDSTFNWRKHHVLAGVCCGFAIASEFPAAIAGGGVLALALLTSFKRGLLLAFAAIPPLLLIPTYNWACFGHPFSFGYHHLALTEFQDMNKGLFGITFPPKASAAYLILVSLKRGLFFWTPFFLIGFLGLRPLWQSSQRIFWVVCTIVIAGVVAISGYYMPDGGGALGPRHLAPILPYLAVLSGFGLSKRPFAGAALGYYSVFLTAAATSINAMPPAGIKNPLVNYYFPNVLWGSFNNTLLSMAGVPPIIAILIFVCFILAFYFLSAQKFAN